MPNKATLFYVVIVVYNKNCSQSASCRSMEGINNINVVIVDNSERDYNNSQFCYQHNWLYINMNGNKGLSKAYNKAIDTIKEKGLLICIFDDDTDISSDYFETLSKMITQERETKIFLPIVYDDLGLVSPSLIKGMVVERVSDIKEITKDRITGINSGMAIKSEVFDDYRYNEEFFLDFIDHEFIREMKNRRLIITIFDAKLYHRLFFAADSNIDSVIIRFKMFKKDFRLFCGKSIRGRIDYHKVVFKQKLYFFLKYDKKIRLLFI